MVDIRNQQVIDQINRASIPANAPGLLQSHSSFQKWDRMAVSIYRRPPHSIRPVNQRVFDHYCLCRGLGERCHVLPQHTYRIRKTPHKEQFALYSPPRLEYRGFVHGLRVPGRLCRVAGVWKMEIRQSLHDSFLSTV